MKNQLRLLLFFPALALTLTFSGCSKDKNGERLLFSVEDDIAMGQQTAHQVDSIYAAQILSPSQYPEAYAYLESAKQEILQSGKIAYKDEFAWKLTIIDDNTLNAFCTPGGHIYFYTGLIKYLDSGDHLIGVLGHEMAHADKRHTSQSLQREYGLSVLLSIVTGGNPGMLTQIAASLVSLDYSREHETEADAWSVEYLAQTNYACNGAAGFFQKLIDQGSGSSGPAFLSTHPNPDNRVQKINQKADDLNCDKTPTNDNFQAMKNTLP